MYIINKFAVHNIKSIQYADNVQDAYRRYDSNIRKSTNDPCSVSASRRLCRWWHRVMAQCSTVPAGEVASGCDQDVRDVTSCFSRRIQILRAEQRSLNDSSCWLYCSPQPVPVLFCLCCEPDCDWSAQEDEFSDSCIELSQQHSEQTCSTYQKPV